MAKKAKAAAEEVKVKTNTVATLSALLQGRTIEFPKTEKKTVSTSTWKGTLSFGMVSFGVKCYKAADEEKISFNLIHSECQTQLKRGSMKCPSCNKEVDEAEIAHGYKTPEDKFITLTEDEIKSSQPLSDKIMTVTEFVKANDVDPLYFEGAQYLCPEKGSEKPFALLREGMVRTNTVGISRRVERGREQTLLVRPYGKHGMVIHYLYFDHEIRSCEKWSPFALADKEVEIAGMLIEQLTEPFRPETKFDSYIVGTKKLIERKMKGEKIEPASAPQVPAQTGDIMATLMTMLNNAKTKKAAVKSA
jgi:DNA end-binding protein Ku